MIKRTAQHKPLLLTVPKKHRKRLFKVIKLSGWCYNAKDYVSGKISAIHKYISANCF